MKKKVVRLTEAQLRSLVNEMLGDSSDDSWTQLDDAFGSVKHAVQSLQGALAAGQHRQPSLAGRDAARLAQRAQAAINRLKSVVDNVVASTGGAGA